MRALPPLNSEAAAPLIHGLKEMSRAERLAALERSLPLATRDAHFNRVPGLTVHDRLWGLENEKPLRLEVSAGSSLA